MKEDSDANAPTFEYKSILFKSGEVQEQTNRFLPLMALTIVFAKNWEIKGITTNELKM